MIEMSALLEDLHDPTGRAEQQLNRFFASVRGALQIISKEVREIAAESPPMPTR
jgi:hypothetical protein